MSVRIRRFRRSDRDQLTALVNAHVQAVVPGITLPTNRVLSQLEGEPNDFIVDPWVAERHTLVAEQRGRVAAAAHLLTFRDAPDVGGDYRAAGEIRWLLQWPVAPFWPDADQAGRVVLQAAVEVLGPTRVIRCDPSLPAPAVYGVPREWPHIEQRLVEAGFRPGKRTEHVWLAELEQLERSPAPLPGLRVRRSLGINGTRLTGELSGDRVGYIEVEIRSSEGTWTSNGGAWADIGNLEVEPSHQRGGIGRWLVGEAARWLELGHVDRLLGYSDDALPTEAAFAAAVGFEELTQTRRGWELRAS